MFCETLRGRLRRLTGVFALSLLLMLLPAGCGRRAAPDFERVAVLRFENLTPDESLDWMGRGFAEVLATELSGSPRIYAISFYTLHNLDPALGRSPLNAPGVSSERQQAFLAGANRVVCGQYELAHGTLRVNATEFDLLSNHVLRTFSESGPASAGMLPLARRIAGAWGEPVRAYPTGNETALRAYSLAQEAAEPEVAARAFGEAISADPNFGPAYLGAFDWAIARHDRVAAEKILAEAHARSGGMGAFDRVRLDLDAATLRGDRAGRVRALAEMLRWTPADASLYLGVAGAALTEHRIADAVAAFRKAASIQPENVEILNGLGYASALQDDLAGATEALRRYAALRPQEANPLDSLGDVNLYLGHLSEAERSYLEAYQKSPAFLDGGTLLKAAYARLMQGDVAEADRIFERYSADRVKARDPLLGMRAAEWSWAAGRRRAAMGLMQVFAQNGISGPLREVAAEAYARLVFWNLELGDRAAASEWAQKATAAAGPATMNSARMVAFLTQPEASASEWAVRAERQFPEPAQGVWKSYALAYALLFAKEFAAAAPLIQQIYAANEPAADWGLPVLAAWAYSGMGRWQDAAPLARHNPIPQVANLGAFPSMWFPRVFYLRAQALAHQGKQSEAAPLYQLFLKLSGPDAEIWGEEQEARKATSR